MADDIATARLAGAILAAVPRRTAISSAALLVAGEPAKRLVAKRCPPLGIDRWVADLAFIVRIDSPGEELVFADRADARSAISTWQAALSNRATTPGATGLLPARATN